MASQTESFPDSKVGSLPWELTRRYIFLSLLFASAAAVRLYALNEPLIDFQPVRQYRSALIARAYYYDMLDSLPAWKENIGSINRELEGLLEPPLMELLSAFIYTLNGHEELWIPRFLSILSWLTGGIFLYMLARELVSENAAFVSTAFYLFVPFGIRASRSFQPESAMLMLLIASLWMIVRYHLRPSQKRLLIAGIISGFAILVKPVCLFIILFSATALAVYSRRMSSQRSFLHFIWFVSMALLPSSLYYLYGIFSVRSLTWQAQSSFVPQLIFEPYYWIFWLHHIYRVIGFTPLVIALLGTLLFSEAWQRVFALGLWSGYFTFGLIFTYHIHTHDYYQLQLIPVVALSMAPAAELLFSYITKPGFHWFRQMAIWAGLLFAILLNVGLYVKSREELPNSRAFVGLAEKVGQAVKHSGHTILLTPNPNPKMLRYYGEFAGYYWPYRAEMGEYLRMGLPEIGTEERLRLLGVGSTAEYFVVTDRQEFDAQVELKDFLYQHSPVVAENDAYILFDLHDVTSLSNDSPD